MLRDATRAFRMGEIFLINGDIALDKEAGSLRSSVTRSSEHKLHRVALLVPPTIALSHGPDLPISHDTDKRAVDDLGQWKCRPNRGPVACPAMKR